LNPQGIFLSRQYGSVLRSFGKCLVNPNLGAIITPPNGLSGLNRMRSMFDCRSAVLVQREPFTRDDETDDPRNRS
ncbi:MAG: hypothetical protein PHQ14_10480, partial [Chromatiales bacterium]|nr:hypothetical protein [Chromatiales bacterium]